MGRLEESQKDVSETQRMLQAVIDASLSNTIDQGTPRVFEQALGAFFPGDYRQELESRGIRVSSMFSGKVAEITVDNASGKAGDGSTRVVLRYSRNERPRIQVTQGKWESVVREYALRPGMEDAQRQIREVVDAEFRGEIENS